MIELSKRKIVYLSIAIACVMGLLISFMGLLPEIFIEKAVESVLSKKPGPGGKIEGVEVSQAIEGIYLPTYDKAGREQMVFRGEHAAFINNRLYKITNPVIDVFYAFEEEPSVNPSSVTITALHGEMDKVTNTGLLYDNVVIKLTEKMYAYTNDLKYEPDKRRIHTDGTVTIVGERTKAVGKGFAVDLKEQNARIENDVELDMSPDLAEDARTDKFVGATHITSNGPFIFEKQANTAAFQDSAHVTRGALTLDADNLEFHLDPDSGKLTRLVAQGNVLASEASTVAKAKTLTWDALSQIVTLEGEPVAELLEGNTSISSSKIVLNQKNNGIEVPLEGRLVTAREANDGHPSPPVTVTWKGSMSFEKDKHEALFKKDVEITKEDLKVNCGILLVNFGMDNSSVKTLKASKAVHLLETKGGLRREAKASQVMWEAGGNIVEMVAEPYAWVQEGNRQLNAPYIAFLDNGQKIVGEGQGNLSITEDKGDEGSGNSGAVNVSWLDRMVFDRAQQRAFFYGGVKTVKGEQKVESDQLDVFLNGNNNFDKIIAKGNVYFKDLRAGGIEGVGDIANWDCKLGFVVLGGNPKAELRREKSRSFSRLISYDLQSQRINWEKDTHLQIPFSKR